jgi:uncharacterized protein YqeY
MSLRTQLETDMKAAMKARDTGTRDTLRYLLSALKNAEIDRRSELSEEDGLKLLRSQLKQRHDSIEQFRSGGREDLAEKEEAQVRVIERYLPQQMDDAELEAFVKAGISEAGAASPKDMGKVMGLLTARSEGRVDGKRLSSAVRNALAG